MRSLGAWAAFAAAAVVATGLAGCTSSDGGVSAGAANPAVSAGPSTVAVPAAAAVPKGAAAASVVNIPDVVARVDPSVVTVVVSGSGLGSGVVYREGGIVVTNEHVVSDARQVEIELADGSRVPAEVLATDVETDLAVLRAARKNLPPVKFQPVQPRVGELVLAMGSPLGLPEQRDGRHRLRARP